MRLTPADVHNVAFKKPSIGKRGYDEDEVDAFLDIVEAELTRLIEENNDLRQQLAAYESGQVPAGGMDYQQAPPQQEAGQGVQDYIDRAPVESAPEHEAPTEQLYTHDASQGDGAAPFAPVAEEPPAPVEQPAPVAEPAPAPVVEAVPVTAAPAATPADHHMQAARLLGLAQETAERVTAEANAEAEQVRSNARAESEKMLSDARNESERMLTEAKNTSESMVAEATAKAESTIRDSQIKAEAMDREAQRKYSEVMNQLTAQRTSLENKIDGLRTYEREYRSRLKNWISDQLQQLDASEGDGSSGQPVGAGHVSSPAEYSTDQNG
ncbi:MAG TPA: DivIVA domain-containing protein [Nakamurella sp.]|nr:DivIVA domain-containing protein [Nakamurella sp.]